MEANIRALQMEFAAEEEEVNALLELAQQSEQVQLDAAIVIRPPTWTRSKAKQRLSTCGLHPCAL